MTGSEWFAAAPGGLNRYFTDLYLSCARRPEIEVTASAFGEPPAGARSWGPTGGGTARRAARAARDRPARGAILDRHFCLYGPVTTGPLVVHFHGPWAAESRATGASERAVRAKYLLERLRYARADRFVVLSNHFRDLLTADYRVPADRVAVIAPGVDLDRFAATEPLPEEPRVLCVRRLERRMGIDTLIACWPAVLDRRPGARLTIVGTGSAAADLRAAAAGRPGIEFTGRVSDGRLAELYARARCTVVPSHTLEGFGLIALESLAAGRAPVVSDCGGLPDSVRGLDPSLVVAPGDPAALAARLAAALDGAVPSAKQCRVHAESFSWDAAARRHVQLYRELAAS
ncbi:glycosyltransferase family 4 protein [Nocardia blacklockiae]|uniref:glycosyltransferase family 4 protein n=1 Tax=Nocardia blacklockiae TaxID=480036 RepID=UPI00189637CF|nr:glycosyltransferase family 4 protein [Nocardia blacklockiae]MBF6176281.1 glycosyltransferase family 4 protein [Nocardia blacklockiae]